MQCPRCQTENPPQAKFCLECASFLARACPIGGPSHAVYLEQAEAELRELA